MNFYTKISVAVILFGAGIVRPLDNAAHAALQKFLGNYKRPITIFEICGNEARVPIYAHRLRYPKKSASTSVILLASKANDTAILSTDAQRIIQDKVARTLILVPDFGLDRVTILGKVEQPELVFVHDMPQHVFSSCEKFEELEEKPRRLRSSRRDFVNDFLGVGDYLALDISPQEMIFFNPRYKEDERMVACIPHKNGDGGMFILFKTGKKGLYLARWDQVLLRKKPKVTYTITSDFEHKYLNKPELKSTSEWLPGINLETFVVLWGTYPSFDNIRATVRKNFKSYSHNDFVLGNLVIQGRNDLVAIDHDDSRRDASFKKHYAAILDAFKKCEQKEFMRCYHGLIRR